MFGDRSFSEPVIILDGNVDRIVFHNCIFHNSMVIDKTSAGRIVFKHCSFVSSSVIRNTRAEKIDFLDCIFKNKINIDHCVVDSLLFCGNQMDDDHLLDIVNTQTAHFMHG